MRVNAAAYGGYLRVEALDPTFKSYEGFSAHDCYPLFSGDPKQVWHTDRWPGSPDVCALWNKPVHLVFDLHRTPLYAFEFVQSSA